MSLVTVLSMLGNYEDRMVGRTELDNGLCVSTAYTTDNGYETAILTEEEVYPVERYGFNGKGEAVAGHERWVAFAKDGIGKKIQYLGSNYDTLEEDGEVVLS